MGNLNFFLSQEEREGFVDLCFEKNCKIVPHMHYAENSYYALKNMKEYKDYGTSHPMFSILNDLSQLYPLEMDFFEKDSQNIYFIKQRYGGPSIEFYSPIFAEIENNRIGPGFISVYPSFYHYDEKFIPKEELLKMFKLLGSYIKSISKGIVIGSKKYWIGNDTIERFKNGTLDFVEMDDFNWNTLR